MVRAKPFERLARSVPNLSNVWHGQCQTFYTFGADHAKPFETLPASSVWNSEPFRLLPAIGTCQPQVVLADLGLAELVCPREQNFRAEFYVWYLKDSLRIP